MATFDPGAGFTPNGLGPSREFRAARDRKNDPVDADSTDPATEVVVLVVWGVDPLSALSSLFDSTLVVVVGTGFFFFFFFFVLDLGTRPTGDGVGDWVG